MVSGVVHPVMSVSGLCQICEAAEARHRCEACGNLVCTDHYEPGLGLCARCAESGGGRTV